MCKRGAVNTPWSTGEYSGLELSEEHTASACLDLQALALAPGGDPGSDWGLWAIGHGHYLWWGLLGLGLGLVHFSELWLPGIWAEFSELCPWGSSVLQGLDFIWSSHSCLVFLWCASLVIFWDATIELRVFVFWAVPYLMDWGSVSVLSPGVLGSGLMLWGLLFWLWGQGLALGSRMCPVFTELSYLVWKEGDEPWHKARTVATGGSAPVRQVGAKSIVHLLGLDCKCWLPPGAFVLSWDQSLINCITSF